MKFFLDLYQLCSHHIHLTGEANLQRPCFSFSLVNGPMIRQALPPDQCSQEMTIFCLPPPRSEAQAAGEQNKSHPLPRPQHVISSQSASCSNERGNKRPNEVSNVCHLRITIFLNCTFKKLESRTQYCQIPA